MSQDWLASTMNDAGFGELREDDPGLAPAHSVPVFATPLIIGLAPAAGIETGGLEGAKALGS